jgi:hypothetical protein
MDNESQVFDMFGDLAEAELEEELNIGEDAIVGFCTD